MHFTCHILVKQVCFEIELVLFLGKQLTNTLPTKYQLKATCQNIDLLVLPEVSSQTPPQTAVTEDTISLNQKPLPRPSSKIEPIQCDGKKEKKILSPYGVHSEITFQSD